MAKQAEKIAAIVPLEDIEQAIYLIRGRKVLLDRDLASLYHVETRVLNQAVTRNLRRFPDDFMFELTRQEIMRISQTVTSSVDLKFSKRVRGFTEQGVAMLSSMLRSERAIDVNIAIMRTFVRFPPTSNVRLLVLDRGRLFSGVLPRPHERKGADRERAVIGRARKTSLTNGLFDIWLGPMPSESPDEPLDELFDFLGRSSIMPFGRGGVLSPSCAKDPLRRAGRLEPFALFRP